MQTRILWSLVWRSVALAPLGLLMLLVVVLWPILTVALPVCAACSFYMGVWWWGGGILAVWLGLIACRRSLARLMAEGFDSAV